MAGEQLLDADAAEAVDFCELYLRDAIRLSGPQPVSHRPGTRNRFIYMPMGIGVIIPPWNFPLAITVGMTMSAVVTGNVAIVKPSSLTPIIAAKFIDACLEAGIPDGVVNFLPGPGEQVGMRLVEHPGVRFISFTGSREVGEKIVKRIKWWEDHCARTGGEMNNNPSPGNKAGGLTTILEKSLGAVAKGGTTNLQAVYERMRSERQKMAERYRSAGLAESQ